MPSLYKSDEQVAQTWVRAAHISIDNPIDGAPSATFLEERAISTGGSTATQRLGSIVELFAADEAFDLLHPETGAVIGSATYNELRVLLHSLYFHVAQKRDEAHITAPVQEQP